MVSKFKTTTIDKGYKNAIKTINEFTTKPSVKIGVLEKSGNHDEAQGLTVADVASFNEFGTETIPERSFIRSTVDLKFNSYVEKSRMLQSKCVLQALSVKKALSVLGELIRADIINTINSGVEPENAPSTIASKRSSKPLIDSGQLKQSINYEIEGV